MNENLMSLVSNFVPTKNVPSKFNDAIKPLNGMMVENFEIMFGDLLELDIINGAVEEVDVHVMNDAISFAEVNQGEFELINNFGNAGANISMENLLISSEVPKLVQPDAQIIAHVDGSGKYEVSQNIMQNSGKIISAEDFEVNKGDFHLETHVDFENDVNFKIDASEKPVESFNSDSNEVIEMEGEVGETSIGGHKTEKTVGEVVENDNGSFEVAEKSANDLQEQASVSQQNSTVKVVVNTDGKNSKVEAPKDFKIANNNSKNNSDQTTDSAKDGKVVLGSERQVVANDAESSEGHQFSDAQEDAENFEISSSTKSSHSQEGSKKGGFEKVLSGADGQTSKVKISENADIVKQNAEHMKVQIERAAKNGDEKMTIQLKPIELGKIDITIERVGNNIQNISIASEKAETMEMLQKDASQLMKLFGENRQNADLNFSMMNQEQQQHSGEFEQVAPNLDEVVTENLIASYEREGLNIVI